MEPILCSACGGTCSPKFCKAKATDIPLKCAFAADPEEHKLWSAPSYGHSDGKQYAAVERPVVTPEGRKGTEIDLPATLKRPRVAPKDRPHLHVTCQTCGFESVREVV